jgi:hypothetical protein
MEHTGGREDDPASLTFCVPGPEGCIDGPAESGGPRCPSLLGHPREAPILLLGQVDLGTLHMSGVYSTVWSAAVAAVPRPRGS